MLTRSSAVLIVDDEDAIRDSIRMLLEDQGYTVYEAPDGKPALVRLREHPEGLVVLLDLQMPGMDGLTLLRALAASGPGDRDAVTCHVFLVVTAQSPHALPPDLADLFRRHDIRIIRKPFDIDTLVTAVQEAEYRLESVHRTVRQRPPNPRE